MRVESMIRFKDLEAKRIREAGEVFEVSEERLAKLNGTRYGEIVRPVEDAPHEDTQDTPREAVELAETVESEPTAPVMRGRRNRRADGE